MLDSVVSVISNTVVGTFPSPSFSLLVFVLLYTSMVNNGPVVVSSSTFT